MLLPPAIREASGHFLNWIYNDVFHAADGPKRVALGDFANLPGIGTDIRVFYEWVESDGASRLTLGLQGERQRMASRAASTTYDRPPFSLLMRVWIDVCHKAGAIDEGALIDMDGPIDHARIAERSVYGDCW